jgi:hypothetical protein
MVPTQNGDYHMATRSKRSERYFIDAKGDECDRMELATGGGYSLVSKDGSEIQSWEQQSGLPAGSIVTMHFVLGWWTKIGNVVNTVVNDKADPGTLDDAALAVVEHIENCNRGVWREVTEGTARGPKYDKDVLAGALFAILTAGNKAKGDLAHYRDKFEDKSYAAKARARTDVMAQYFKDLAAKGEQAKVTAIDDLA